MDADPYARSAQETACQFCPFAAACHFEPGQGSDRIQYLRSTKAEEFWPYIEKTVKEAGGND